MQYQNRKFFPDGHGFSILFPACAKYSKNILKLKKAIYIYNPVCYYVCGEDWVLVRNLTDFVQKPCGNSDNFYHFQLFCFDPAEHFREAGLKYQEKLKTFQIFLPKGGRRTVFNISI